LHTDEGAGLLVLLGYPTWQRLDELLDTSKEVSRAAVHALQRIVSSFMKASDGS
jgi:hypothetical protein